MMAFIEEMGLTPSGTTDSTPESFYKGAEEIPMTFRFPKSQSIAKMRVAIVI